jgi:hypothetical protein
MPTRNFGCRPATHFARDHRRAASLAAATQFARTIDSQLWLSASNSVCPDHRLATLVVAQQLSLPGPPTRNFGCRPATRFARTIDSQLWLSPSNSVCPGPPTRNFGCRPATRFARTIDSQLWLSPSNSVCSRPSTRNLLCRPATQFARDHRRAASLAAATQFAPDHRLATWIAGHQLSLPGPPTRNLDCRPATQFGHRAMRRCPRSPSTPRPEAHSPRRPVERPCTGLGGPRRIPYWPAPRSEPR